MFDKDIPRARRLAERAVEAGRRTGVPDLLIIAKSRLGQVLVSAGGRSGPDATRMISAEAPTTLKHMPRGPSGTNPCRRYRDGTEEKRAHPGRGCVGTLRTLRMRASRVSGGVGPWIGQDK